MPAAKGNDYARKYTLEDAVDIFEQGAEWAAIDEDALCIQDVFLWMKMPCSTFNALVREHKVLASIKEDMQSSIISRVNAKALTSGFAAAPAIWRLKQMGESDQQNINVTSSGKSLPDWMNEGD